MANPSILVPESGQLPKLVAQGLHTPAEVRALVRRYVAMFGFVPAVFLEGGYLAPLSGEWEGYSLDTYRSGGEVVRAGRKAFQVIVDRPQDRWPVPLSEFTVEAMVWSDFEAFRGSTPPGVVLAVPDTSEGIGQTPSELSFSL